MVWLPRNGVKTGGHTDLAARLARLEAIEEIRRLKIAYARACDQGYDPDRIAPLFTHDAVWDGTERYGVYRGRDAIHEFFANAHQLIPWALHYIVAPVIDVLDEDNATGQWYLWQICAQVLDGQPQPVIMGAFYHDRYRREDDGWKIAELRLEHETITRLHTGWVTERFFTDTKA